MDILITSITNSIELFIKYHRYYLRGTGITLLVSFFGVFLGVFFGLLLALMNLSKNKILKGISRRYINFIRGTPLLVQVFIVYLGLQLVGFGFMPDLWLVIISVSFIFFFYCADILRGLHLLTHTCPTRAPPT